MAKALAQLRVRRFRFSLWALLLAITLVGVAIGWRVALVHQRTAMREWILENGGAVLLRSRLDEPLGFDRHGKKVITGFYDIMGPDDLSAARRWLGDEAVMLIELTNDERLEQVKRLFPEAGVQLGMTEWGPIILPDLPSIKSESHD
jgi:hypothetical protein